MTLSILKLSIKTLSITSLSINTLSIITLGMTMTIAKLGNVAFSAMTI